MGIESLSDNPSVIRAFNLHTRTADFLPEVLPLLSAEEHWEHVRRVTNSAHHLQILWEKGNERHTDFTQLCLTLSKQALSLTIATNSSENQLSRSTFVIEKNAQTLHQTHKHDFHSLGVSTNEQATAVFRPIFNRTLSQLNYAEEYKLAG